MATVELDAFTLTEDQRLRRSFFLAGLVILCYDHLLTLGAEVPHIWTPKLKCSSACFLVVRYVALLGNLALIPYFFRGIQSRAENSLLIIQETFVESTLALRVLAMYGFSRRVNTGPDRVGIESLSEIRTNQSEPDGCGRRGRHKLGCRPSRPLVATQILSSSSPRIYTAQSLCLRAILLIPPQSVLVSLPLRYHRHALHSHPRPPVPPSAFWTRSAPASSRRGVSIPLTALSSPLSVPLTHTAANPADDTSPPPSLAYHHLSVRRRAPTRAVFGNTLLPNAPPYDSIRPAPGNTRMDPHRSFISSPCTTGAHLLQYIRASLQPRPTIFMCRKLRGAMPARLPLNNHATHTAHLFLIRTDSRLHATHSKAAPLRKISNRFWRDRELTHNAICEGGVAIIASRSPRVAFLPRFSSKDFEVYGQLLFAPLQPRVRRHPSLAHHGVKRVPSPSSPRLIPTATGRLTATAAGFPVPPLPFLHSNSNVVRSVPRNSDESLSLYHCFSHYVSHLPPFPAHPSASRRGVTFRETHTLVAAPPTAGPHNRPTLKCSTPYPVVLLHVDTSSYALSALRFRGAPVPPPLSSAPLQSVHEDALRWNYLGVLAGAASLLRHL
ncbi:hypothetical protein DFH09DRAFT_1281447 [Mycena vulgaris]|nr:hypothetical protein DFH09DRAFT_1281447 [Mycena vulgaris]